VPGIWWGAVVRGAVVCGVEKDTMANLSRAIPCPRHYAINLTQQYSRSRHSLTDITIDPLTNQPVAMGQLVWLFNKGDLILSDRPATVSQPLIIVFGENDSRQGTITIYSYPDDEDRPTKIQNSMDGA
jgi:hypothetical protein